MREPGFHVGAFERDECSVVALLAALEHAVEEAAQLARESPVVDPVCVEERYGALVLR